MAQTIYFDESGFTGNNLLHPEQKFFAYASVAIEHEEATQVVSELIAKYGVQGNELKGSRLVKFYKGRKLISDLFQRLDGRIKISISDKKFALACKLFEYIFEPSVAEISSIFYQVGFHRFIANVLYMELMARGAGAEEVFAEFEELARQKDLTKLDSVFSSSMHSDNSPIITQIRELAQYRVEDIRSELSSLEDTGVGKWLLDLSNTSLTMLLAHWGKEFDQLTAICDQSKPLQQEHSVADAMIGRTDKLFSDISGELQPITFNLSGPIQFLDSKDTPGIQIADAFAAAAVFVFSGADKGLSTDWREALAKCGHYGSIIPDFDELDLGSLKAQRNALILLELHSRAKDGQSLTKSMPDYIEFITQQLQSNPISQE